jgi:hypothetical protein
MSPLLRVRSKTDVALKNDVLWKFLSHNICVLIQNPFELGIEPVYWPVPHGWHGGSSDRSLKATVVHEASAGFHLDAGHVLG